MARPQTHSVRRHATEGRIDGKKQMVYVASCSCGDRYSGTKSARNRWAVEHLGLV